MTDCPECHRRVGRVSSVRTHATTVARCANRGGPLCEIAAAAYQRGRAAGINEAVEVARDCVRLFGHNFGDGGRSEIDWTEVDAEIERRKGEA